MLALVGIFVLTVSDELVSVLDYFGMGALLIAVVGFPFMLVSVSNSLVHRKGERPFPKGALLFGVPLMIGMLSSFISASIAESKTREFLELASDRSTVAVDGRVIHNGQEVLRTLRGFSHIPAHHSHPTRTLNVDISDPPRHLLLWVARDSSDPQEYWVFVPSPTKLAFQARLRADVGHIKTSVLDEY